jgi:hypothetical protein
LERRHLTGILFARRRAVTVTIAGKLAELINTGYCIAEAKRSPE